MDNVRYNVPVLHTHHSGFHVRSSVPVSSTHQGCPLSLIILALIMELLVAAIKSTAALKGITQNGSQHEDDVILMLTNPQRSFPLAMQICDFSQASFYKWNTTNIYFGFKYFPSSEHILCKYNFQWTADRLQYLGILLTSKSSALYEANYLPLLKSLPPKLGALRTCSEPWLYLFPHA